MFSVTLCALLFGSGWAAEDPEQQVHQGEIALEIGDCADAIELARTVLDQAPDNPAAAALYVDAMIRSGQGSRVLVDMHDVDVKPPEPEVAALHVAVQQDDPAAAKAAMKALDEAYADQPLMRASLWLTDEPAGGIARLQRAVLRSTHDSVDTQSPNWLYQARMIRRAGREDVSDLDDALAAAGEPRPPASGLRTHERSEQARSLVHTPELTLPNLGATELLHLVSRLSVLAVEAKRPERAIEAWGAYRSRWDDPEAALGEGEVLLGMGRAPEALDVFQEAAVLATDPWATDAAVVDVVARARVLTHQLHGLSQSLEANTQLRDALVAVSLAEQLRGGAVDDPLHKRIHKKMLPEYRLVSGEYGAAAAEKALLKARAATDPEEVLTHTSAGMFLFAYADAGPWQHDAGELLWLKSQALSAVGEHDEARVALLLSVLLSPAGTAERWARLGELREAAEQWDAAFAAYATAQDRGAEVADALARVHRGPGEPAGAASSMVTHVPERPEPSGTNVKRTQVYVYSAGRVARPGSMPKGIPVSVGQRMPAWSLKTSGGTINDTRTRGRTVVMFFWVSSCTPCLAALPQVAEVAQDLRRTGRDVAVVAVSMDDEPAHFEMVRRVGEKWGQLVRDPEFGFKMGIRDVPTWWIIDTNGVVRSHSTSWVNARHFERALRRALVE